MSRGPRKPAIERCMHKIAASVLTSDPFKHLTLASGKARILGIARIRSRDSVEALIKAMRLGGNERNRGRKSRVSEPRQRFMPYARLALAVLTGVDKGTSKDAWQKWWKDNKRSFRISKQRPPLSGELDIVGQQDIQELGVVTQLQPINAHRRIFKIIIW